MLEKTTPLTRRILGESHEITLKMRLNYASVLYMDDVATLDDLREAVAMMEEIKPTMRRVLGGKHPLVSILERHLLDSRAALHARETPPGSA